MIEKAILTFSDGKLEIPPEVQQQMHLREGTRLRLVSATPTEIMLEPDGEPAGKPETIDGREPIWIGNRWWVPNDEWKSLQGILSGHPEHDTSKARREEREWELAHEERKFGPFPKSQP